METATNTVAGAAVSSPLWLPQLQTISEIAGMFLPILGAVWLITQIIIKILQYRDNDAK